MDSIENDGKTSMPWRFQPGNKASPGRPKGARSRLQENFLSALSDDFTENGVEAIQTMRRERPSDYVRCIASLMPKQLEVERPLQDMTDDELSDSIEALRRFIAQESGAGSANAQIAESSQVLPPIH